MRRMDNCEINKFYDCHTAVASVGNFEHAWGKPVCDSTNRTLQPYHIPIAPLSSLTPHSQILWPSMLIKPAIYPNLSLSRLPNLELEPAPNSSTNQKSSTTVGTGCQPLLPKPRRLRPKTAKQSREVSPQVVLAAPRKPRKRRRRLCLNPRKKAISDAARRSVVRRKKEDPTLSQRRLAGEFGIAVTTINRILKKEKALEASLKGGAHGL